MKNLYIIGNGFDIYHGLDTKYQSFAKYISQTDSEVYKLVLKYYGLPDISEEPINDEEYDSWETFELSLADLDYEQVLEEFSNSIAYLGSEDFRDNDWHTYKIEMELIVKKLTNRLISIFNNFILDVIYPETIDDRKLELISPSIYLNFNYTDTLQRYYGVKVQDICYIHEKSSKNDCKIILGHGTDPSNFEVNEPKPPNGLNEYELERWWEYMSDQYDYSYESAKDEILSYYTKAFKNTHSIIDKKICFFETLINVECIYVLGHSISEIDIKYFETVKKYVIPNAMWIVTFYSDNEKQKHLEAMTKLGVLPENLNQIRMTDLK